MADDYLEFSILSDRKYTRNHLWMQVVDKEEGTWKIGVSAVSYTHLTLPTSDLV